MEVFTGVLESKASEVKDELEFRRLSASEIMAAQDESQALIKEFIVGDKPIGVVGDRPVYASQTSFNVAAIVSFAQTADENEGRYSALDLLHLMTDDELVICIMKIFDRVTSDKKEGGQEPNFTQTIENPLSVAQ